LSGRFEAEYSNYAEPNAHGPTRYQESRTSQRDHEILLQSTPQIAEGGVERFG
jgi:hypothetical protein